MGAWGWQAFENDDAQDWLAHYLSEDGQQLVRQTLTVAIDGLIECTPACELIAAAEVVAAGLGHPGASLPPEVAARAAVEGPLASYADLAGPAAQICRLVLDPARCELADLWNNDDGDLNAARWQAQVQDLCARLEQ